MLGIPDGKSILARDCKMWQKILAPEAGVVQW